MLLDNVAIVPEVLGTGLRRRLIDFAERTVIDAGYGAIELSANEAMWLAAHLALSHIGLRIVVTHHGPHPGSLPPPALDLAHCYASDLSRLILGRQPDLWVHGHLNSRSDYAIGGTRIVCNARGHADEASGVDPALIVSVGAGVAG